MRVISIQSVLRIFGLPRERDKSLFVAPEIEKLKRKFPSVDTFCAAG